MRQYSLGKRLIEGYLHQPFSWFLNRHTADLGKNILLEVEVIVYQVLNPSLVFIQQTLITLAISTILILVNPKIAIIVCFARFFHREQITNVSSLKNIIVSVAILLMPIVLVVTQPDLGTSILIAASGLIVLWLAGLNIRYFVYSGLAMLVSFPFIISFLKPYQKLRILSFFNPDRDPLGAGYQIIQSKIAVGSGGFTGKGFLQGTQSYLEFLPEKHTDFIFTLFSEEHGFVGSLFLLIIYAILIYRIIRIGSISRSYFGRLFCYGFGSAIFIYITVNMSMVLGLLPIVGSPLPIMSYGGSSMLATMLGISIVMSTKIYHKQIIA